MRFAVSNLRGDASSHGGTGASALPEPSDVGVFSPPNVAISCWRDGLLRRSRVQAGVPISFIAMLARLLFWPGCKPAGVVLSLVAPWANAMRWGA